MTLLRWTGGLALLAMLLVYYGHGLGFQYWPDSSGYLAQGLGLAGLAPFERPADRGVGYPLLVALALRTPWPALVLVLLQAALVIAAFVALSLILARLVVPRLDLEPADRRLARAAIFAGLAAASLYSVIHVQIGALLTEILFAVLALLAVLAVGWLLLPGRTPRRPWLEAPLAAAVATVPLLVKPHWLFAAAFLSIVCGVWLWRVAARSRPAAHLAATPFRRWLLPPLALAVPLAAMLVTVLPDRLLSNAYAARDRALFGPRTAFCIHAHHVLATLRQRPELMLQDEPQFERRFRAELATIVASHTGGWRLLGFNGDLCIYNRELSAMLTARFSEPEAQGRFLLASLARAALSDPFPYAWKVTQQVASGFLTAFPRFAIHTRPGQAVYENAARHYAIDPSFLRGVTLAPELGPLGSRDALKGTWTGRAVHLVLAVVFFAFTLALPVLALVSLLAPLWRWRHWSRDVREVYLVFVALPLATLVTHHALVALIHSFDVWRYGFAVYFVNLLFIGAAVLFWLADWRRWRAARTASVPGLPRRP